MRDTPPKVLITGAAGQLGRELLQAVPQHVDVAPYDRKTLDITSREAVDKALKQDRPDVVVNAAAYTAVDKAEQEAETAFAVNATGPRNLAHACKAHGIRLIHISTDFVFDGSQCTPYSPEEEPEALSVYGRSKLEGERHVLQQLGEQAVVIRVGWLYSRFGKNFVKTMLRLMQEREQLNVVSDQIGTPTHAQGLAALIWRVVEERRLHGIYHWSDAGVASWYDFAVAIMEEGVAAGQLPHPITIRPIPSSDYPTPARRPAYSVLDKSATWAQFGTNPIHWRVALREMIREMGP
jgi:dTDP-4-dehydrorhamnose reductase